MITQEYISLEVLAAMLKLPNKYLKELAESNNIPSLDVNGRLRFCEQQVREALEVLAHSKKGKRCAV